MLAMKAIMQQRSPSPSLSTLNDIATIVGVPLGALLTLIGILLMIKHHREARRQGETSSSDSESLAGIPLQNTTHTATEAIGNTDGVFRSKLLDRPDAAPSCDVSLPARAYTHTGIFSMAQPFTPTRASTYAGTKRHPQHPSLPLPKPPSAVSGNSSAAYAGTTSCPQHPPLLPPSKSSLDSRRTSQITLVDKEEHSNPTMIITYPSAAHIASEGHASETYEIESNERAETGGVKNAEKKAINDDAGVL